MKRLLGPGIAIIIIFFLFPDSLSFNTQEGLGLAVQQRVNIGDSEPENIYFIFLNGLDSRCDGSQYNQMGFEEIRRGLAAADFIYNDERFLLYSYNGGKVSNGRWYPDSYGPRDTGQPIQLSVQNLEYLIEEFSISNPKARYILLGHSLGGRIALDFLISTSEENKSRVKGVITLNSPLTGASFKIPPLIMDAISATGSIIGTPAVRQLVWESYVINEMTQERLEKIKDLQEQGIHVATFATRQDLVVHAATGCLLDQKGEPITDGCIVDVNRLPLKHVFGHMQITKEKEIIQYLVAFYLENVL